MKNASIIYGEFFGDVVSIEAMMNSFAAEILPSYLTSFQSGQGQSDFALQSYNYDNVKRFFYAIQPSKMDSVIAKVLIMLLSRLHKGFDPNELLVVVSKVHIF